MSLLSCFLFFLVSQCLHGGRGRVLSTCFLCSCFAFSVFMLLKPWQTPQSDKVPDQGWTGRAFTSSLSLQAGMLTALHQEFGEKSVFSDSPISWIHRGVSWVFWSL